MKLKTLTKKIRRLEVRLQEGPKKLAKLKRKLETLVTANATKAKGKSATRAGKTRPTLKSSTRAQKKKTDSTAQSPAKPAGAKKRRVAKKVKRKLNLSPERRAQLAAAMKARWAAKRAAAAARPEDSSTG